MADVVVALFRVGPHGPTKQGGHARDPFVPTHTLCGKPVVEDKPSTIRNIRCSACLSETLLAAVRSQPSPPG